MPINTGTETANIRIDSTGAITAAFGVASHGQGLETTLAQVVAEHLGARFEDVRIVQGDSAAVPGGTGTYASRSTRARRRRREARRREPCARRCSTPPRICSKHRAADLVAEDGRVDGRRHRSLGDVPRGRARGLFRDGPAAAGGARGTCRHQDLRSGVRHHRRRRPTSRRSRSIRRRIEIRVDRFVVAEDCGRLINPLIVDGQVHGGVAQGIGAALYEEVVYDDDGQLHTASLVDYLVPSACEIPPMQVVHLESVVADHARRLSRHGRRRHDRRAGGGRQRGRATRCRRSGSRSTSFR